MAIALVCSGSVLLFRKQAIDGHGSQLAHGGDWFDAVSKA